MSNGWKLHLSYLIEEEIKDPETRGFWRDLLTVQDAVHQSMSIVGPWMEARSREMVRSWLPAGWQVSGPAQVFLQDRPKIRSRSWDLIIHRSASVDLPPAASPDSGFPLLPAEITVAVINTKTFFDDVKKSAKEPVFNLMNDATESQLEFLGPAIAKIILTASSSRGSDTMFAAGKEYGLEVYSLARRQAGPVSDGEARECFYKVERYTDGSYPLQQFKRSISAAVAGAVSDVNSQLTS